MTSRSQATGACMSADPFGNRIELMEMVEPASS